MRPPAAPWGPGFLNLQPGVNYDWTVVYSPVTVGEAIDMVAAAAIVAPYLRGASAVGGTATVIEHGGRHASVIVRAGDQVMHTEQIILAGRQTTIATVQGAAPEVRALTVQLPDAAGAIRYQQSVLGQSTGVYDVATNSCVTHCGDVLRAGGLDAPGTTREIIRWLNSLGE